MAVLRSPEDGSTIDATIATINLARGVYANDRIGYEFTALTAPTISDFTPSSGPAGTVVTISGTGFKGASAISFAGVAAASFTVDSSTQLKATVPAGATTGPISVTTPNGSTTSGEAFTVPPPPTIVSLSPAIGPVGTHVEITGTNLGDVTSVTFEGNGTTVSAGFSAWSSQTISTFVPANATTGPITVSTPEGKVTSAQSFTVLATAPRVGRCVRAVGTSGGYANSGCTKAMATGKYEWLPGTVKSSFTTALASGDVTLQTVDGAKITCGGASGAGQYTGGEAVGDLTLTLTGCSGLGRECSSPGAAAGEVGTSTLAGRFGIRQQGSAPAKNKLALDLTTATEGEPVAAFSCGATELSVRGSVLAPVTANKMLNATTLKFADTKGHQKPEGFAGLPADVLEASLDEGAYEQAGLAVRLALTNEEAVEVNASL